MLPVQKPGAPCPPKEEGPATYVASRAPKRRSIHDRSLDFDEKDDNDQKSIIEPEKS